MFNKFIKKLNKKLKEKKGASMAIVITAMSLLIVLGTTFSTLAYNSYKHSYGTICRQQALFTAKSVLDGFIDEFKVNTDLRGKVGTKLIDEVKNNPDVPVNEVNAEINIAGLHDYMADGTIKNGKNVSDCKMYVSYSDNTRSRLRLIVSAKYKGFQNALSAILGYTNKASLELSKIMSNTMFFTSPIVDFMYYVDENNVLPTFKEFAIDGDVYIDKPFWLDKNDPKKNPYTHISAMPNVDGATVEATGGHTLEIDNQGRPNTLFDENGLPKKKGTSKVYLKDGDGRYLPLINASGEIVYEENNVDVYKLQKNYNDFVYIDKDNKETKDKNNAVYDKNNNKLIPEAIVKKDSSGSFLNYILMPDKQIYLQIDSSSTDIGSIEYEGSNTQGVQFGSYNDVQGYPLLQMNGNKELISSWEQSGSLWKRYSYERYGGASGKPDWCFVRSAGGDNWWWSEIYKTIDPKSQEEIFVTGKVKIKGSWIYDSDLSFRKVVEDGSEDGKEENEPRFRFVKSDGISITNIKGKENVGKTLGNIRYNIYKYQKKRATTQVKPPKKAYESMVGPNEWTEVYLRSHYWKGVDIDFLKKHPVPYVINGNLKCNTDVLIGLKNRGFEDSSKKGGLSHGFKDANGNVVPVSFDTKNDAYTIPKYNVLSLTGDIYVNGDIKGENLYVLGNIYAKDDNPDDDDKPGGCKGNVFLEQEVYTKNIIGIPVFLGAYMEMNNIVADGYVVVGGAAADISDRAHIKGNIYAGKYKEDGSRWGRKGIVTSNIPARKFYFENGKGVAEDIIKDYPVIPGGIYGYRTQTECDNGRRSRYELGSGDVVLQQTDVDGSIFATGDVYLSNGVCVKGNIYTPGNVYITKGNETVKLSIENKKDARCRVWGNIYAGGNVAITGGCEVGKYEVTDSKKTGYFSSIYCGGNLYIRGRASGKNHDAVSGSCYVGGDLTIVGYQSDKTNKHFTRVGYNGGNIYVKGDIIANKEITGQEPFIALSNGSGKIYCGGDLKLGEFCALDNHGMTYVEKDCKIYGSYVHTSTLYVGGDLSIGGETWYYKHDDVTTRAYVIGNIINTGKGIQNSLDQGSGPFEFYCNGSVGTFTNRFNSNNNKGKIPATMIQNGVFADSVKPEGWGIVNKADDFINTPKDRVKEGNTSLNSKMDLYNKSVNAQVKKWSSPEYSSNIYKEEYKGKGISADASKKSTFEDSNLANHYIIDDNVYGMPELELKPNSVLTIDTTKKNIQIVLNGNLIVGNGARIEVKGPNMAFIYIEPGFKVVNDKEEKLPQPNLISIGNNAVFGRVVGLDANQTEQNAGLHIVSLIDDIVFEIKPGALINSYNYLPNGVLYINFEVTSSTGSNGLVATPQGSYTISRFKGDNLDVMYNWRVQFTNKKSPLILDINGDLDYGNTDNEIKDFKGVEWVVVEYQ